MRYGLEHNLNLNLTIGPQAFRDHILFCNLKHISSNVALSPTYSLGPRHLTSMVATNKVTWKETLTSHIGRTFDYLHNHCDMPIVHCDLKPGNVLLDNDFVGHVGDFGLAGFLSANEQPRTNITSSRGIRGSIGYTAPEYGIGSEVSTYGDVYSFGILLLKMFTSKRPTIDMFQDGLDLCAFVVDSLLDRLEEIVDPIANLHSLVLLAYFSINLPLSFNSILVK
ncbi:Protein kinase domain-containing protein [Forsythia ovata]|uniref:Protein kinase domain-containing protein n=1 Tax=Forsythia ovata TaxID=205694 RepID=A0ABD1X5U7_9LAMI